MQQEHMEVMLIVLDVVKYAEDAEFKGEFDFTSRYEELGQYAGGNFKTDVLSNRMFDEYFVYFNNGRGATLAMFIFLGVLPIIIYNIRSLRAERHH